MKFIAILAFTARSQSYLQTLVKNKFYPEEIFILDDENKKSLGKINPSKKKLSDSHYYKSAIFNPKEDLLSTLKRTSIPYTIMKTSDINSDNLYLELSNIKTKLVVVSVYPGQLLKDKILSLKKNFLHVHAGKLPKYKGSTTLYYSLLEENKIAISAIYLNQGIDTGKIILIEKFNLNFDLNLLDLIFDPLLRSHVLIKTLKLIKTKNYKLKSQKKEKTGGYFIIHPVLKHLAILKEERNASRNNSSKS